MVIKYETKDGKNYPGNTLSITPCPHNMKNVLGEGPFMVGSFACRDCCHYRSNLKDYWGSVDCIYPEKRTC